MQNHIIVLITQVLFVMFRTLNIQHTINGSILINVLSGIAMSITWLISISLGVKSIIEGDIWLTLTYLISGSIGQTIVLRYKNRHWL